MIFLFLLKNSITVGSPLIIVILIGIPTTSMSLILIGIPTTSYVSCVLDTKFFFNLHVMSRSNVKRYYIIRFNCTYSIYPIIDLKFKNGIKD